MQPETTYQAILGKIFRAKRVERSMDQSTMAEKVGMDASSWSRIENGKTVVNVQQLNKIAQIFGVNAGELLQDADDVARKMESEGCKVHYDLSEEKLVQSSNSGGLYLLAGAALGLLVGRILASKNDNPEIGKSSDDRPRTS